MWDDYDYGGYSDYSYPSYDYSSYSQPSYDYSSYYSQPSYDYSSYYSQPSYDYSSYNQPSSYDYNQPMSTPDYSAYTQPAQNDTALNTNTGWGQQPVETGYNPDTDWSIHPELWNQSSTQVAGPVNYEDLNQPSTSYDSFGNPVAQGSAAAMGDNNVAAQPAWTPSYGGGYDAPTDTTYGGVDNSEIGGGFNPGQSGGGDYNYTSGNQVGPTMPGQQQPYNDYNYTSGTQVGPTMPGQQQPYDMSGYGQQGGQTRSMGGQQQGGYNYGQQGTYGNNQGQGGYGGAVGAGAAGAGASKGWDWNHPIDSLTNMFTGGGTGGAGGTGTGGASGGIFDWLGNNVGGLAAGAAGLYALNKLMDSGSSGGSSSGVNPTAGYGAVGGPIAVKAPAVQLQTPTAASNPGNYIGQMGIQGLSPVVPPKV